MFRRSIKNNRVRITCAAVRHTVLFCCCRLWSFFHSCVVQKIKFSHHISSITLMNHQLFNPSTFNWEDAPLNKVQYPITACAVYLFLVFFIEKKALNNEIPPPIVAFARKWQVYHNLSLSIASFLLVAATIISILCVKFGYLSSSLEDNPDFLTCTLSSPPSRGLLWYFVYLFYLTKYWELLDTLLQMVKGKRPPSFFFHMWHHTVYLMICYYYCQHRSSLAILAVCINGSVHILMYFYYYLVSAGRVPKWKRYITQVQIVQFVAGYCIFSRTLKKQYIDRKPCNGKEILTVHAGFNLTMLIGFIQILTRIQRARLVKKI